MSTKVNKTVCLEKSPNVSKTVAQKVIFWPKNVISSQYSYFFLICKNSFFGNQIKLRIKHNQIMFKSTHGPCNRRKSLSAQKFIFWPN